MADEEAHDDADDSSDTRVRLTETVVGVSTGLIPAYWTEPTRRTATTAPLPRFRETNH